MHLTNNAVQQHGHGFGRFEDGNMMTFTALFAKSTLGDKQAVDCQVRDIARLVYHAARRKLNPDKLSHCFELFGLDIIIDTNMKCWLLEVNSNPSLEAANREVSAIKHRLVGRLVSRRRHAQAHHRPDLSRPSGCWRAQQVRPRGQAGRGVQDGVPTESFD